MLGFAEFCVPGNSLEDKLFQIQAHRLWLEMICTGERDLNALSSYEIEVRSVQAYLLHRLNLLSRDKGVRKAAVKHIKESITLARNVGAGNVITVPAYGFNFMENTFGECVNIFRNLSKFAGEICILIEGLSPIKTSFLPSLVDVDSLVSTINRDNVKLMADTGHIYDCGEDVENTLLRFRDKLAEVHLKDTESKPPGQGLLNFEKIVKMLRKSQLCVEYRPRDLEKDFKETVKYLKRQNFL